MPKTLPPVGAVIETDAPVDASLDVGVTEPVPDRPVTEPLKLIRAPGQTGPKPLPPVGEAVDVPLPPAPDTGVAPEVSSLREQFESDSGRMRALRRSGPGASPEQYLGSFPTAKVQGYEGDPAATEVGQWTAVQLSKYGPGQDAERKAAYLKWLSEHSDLDRETAGEIAQAAAATGLPAEYVQQNLPAIRKQLDAQHTDYADLARRHPAIADFLLEDTYKFHLVAPKAEEMGALGDTALGRWWDRTKRVFVEDQEQKLRQGAAAQDAAFPPAPDRTVGQVQAEWEKMSLGEKLKSPTGLESPTEFYERRRGVDTVSPLGGDRSQREWLASVEAAEIRHRLTALDAMPFLDKSGQERERLDARLLVVEKNTPAGLVAENQRALARLSSEVSGARNYGDFSRTLLGRIVYAPADMGAFLVGNTAAAGLAGPAGVAAFNYQQVYGSTAYELQQQKGPDGKPMDPKKALALANLDAAGQAAIQTLPLSRVVSKVPGVGAALSESTAAAVTRALTRPAVGKAALELLKDGGIDVVTGAAAMAASAAHSAGIREVARVQMTPGAQIDPGKMITASEEAFTRALVDMLPVAFAPGFSRLAADVGRWRAAGESRSRIQALVERAKKVEDALQVAPAESRALLQRVLEQAGPNGGVADRLFADLARWDEHWQAQGQDPRAVAAEAAGDGGAAYDKAKAEKADRLAISAPDFLVRLATGERAKGIEALLQDLATGADTPTPRQAAEEAKIRLKRAKELAAVEPDKMEADQRQVYDEFKKQAREAGEDEKSADANAKVAASSLKVLAERAGRGESALDLWRVHPWNIEGPLARTRERLHLEDAFAEYDSSPAGKAHFLLGGGTPEGGAGIVAAHRERAAAAGQVEVPAEIKKRMATIQREVRALEGQATGTRSDASALERPSPTRKVRVRLTPDPEGGARLELHEGAAGEGVRDVRLPAWLKPEEFLGARAAWEWTWSALERGPEAAEPVQRAVHEFMRQGTEGFPPSEFALKQGFALARLAAGRGGKKYAALREAVRDWAEKPEGGRGPLPIPEKVWGALIDTTRKDVDRVSNSRGYQNKVKREVMDKWLAQTRAELDPNRPTYGERPPAWYAEAKDGVEAKPIEVVKSDARLAELRGELEALTTRAKAEGRPPAPALDWEATTAILGKDADRLPTVEGGLHPDDLARAVGSESGDKLLRDMLGMGDRTAWAKEQAAARIASGAEPRLRRPADLRIAEIERRLSEIMPASAARELATDYLRARPEKQADIYYRHPKSNLLNERALWDAPPDPERPLLAQVQISGKKKANDTAGHDALDKVLRVVGRELHAAGADHVAQVGSDVMFRAKDQAQAQRVLDQAKAKLPGWMETSVQVGERKATLRETVDAINTVHGPEVERRRAVEKSFAGREDLPHAFQAQGGERAYRKALAALPDRGALPEVSKDLRAKHAAMDPREAAEKAFRTSGGLLTAAGWAARRASGKAKAHVASMDLRKIKRLNETFGRDVTDKILHEIEEMVRDEGGADFDAAHLSGDEFAFQHDDKKALEKFRDRVRAAGREMSYRMRKKSTGEVAVADGLELAVGIGKDWDHADGEALEADKAALDRELGAGWEERRIRREADGGAGGGRGAGEPGGLGAAGGEARLEGGLERGRARPEAPGLAQDLAGLAPERIAEVRSLVSERDALTRRAAQGTLKQRSRLTETPEFKAWFGKSKAVGENGEPVVAYHGTAGAGFEAFDEARQDKVALYGPGFYFTENPEVASSYVDKGEGTSQGVIPAYLRIEHPFRVDAPATEALPVLERYRAPVGERPPPEVRRMIDAAFREDPSVTSADAVGSWIDNTEWAYKIADKMGKGGEEIARPFWGYILERATRSLAKQIREGEITTGEELVKEIERNVFDVAESNGANIKDVLTRLGYDGITHVGGNIRGDGKTLHRVWIAFKPEQIKSVFNRGTFDPKDPRILHQLDLGGGIAARLSDRDRSRGEIVFDTAGPGEPVHLNIRILKGDKSTLAHETFHALSLVMGQVATRADAPADLRAEYQKLLDVMGYKDHAERMSSMEDRKEERASHLWEQYLSEGKAPSAELLTAFARFKTWLKRIYQSIEGIRSQYRKQYGEDLPELSDDVRSLFGRMLAGDEAVADAAKESESDMPPAPLTPEERRQSYALRDEARAAAEAALQRHLITEEKKTDRAFMKEQRSLMEAKVRTDLEASDPAVRAAVALERGDLDGVPVKLDREALKEAVGPEVAAQVPKSMTGNAGAHPDLVADLLGFDSPAEMVRQVLAADVETKVKAETTRRMAEAYPKLEDRPAMLREIAKQKVQDGDPWLRDGLLRLAAIEREAGLKPSRPDPAAMKDAAREAIQERPYSALEVGRYEAAAKAFARKASELKDPEKRRDAFEAYLFNTLLAKQAREARETIEATTRHLQKYTTDAKRAELGKATVEVPGPDGQVVVGQPYLSAMDSLLEAFELRPSATRKDVEGRATQAAALEKWAKERWDDGDTVIIPDSVLANLKRQVFWKDLSAKEIGDLRDAADSIAQQAKLRTVFEVGGKKVETEQVIRELVGSADTHGAGVRLFLTGKPTIPEQAAELGRYALGGLRRLEETFDYLDGRRPNGPWKKFIWGVMSDAGYRYHDLVRDSNKPIQDALRRLPASERRRMRQTFTEDGIQFTIEEAIGALLNSGSESNLSKMIRGMSGAGMPKDTRVPTWNGRGTLDKILSHLTQADVDLVNTIHKTLESRWDAMSDLEKKDSGLPPKKVQTKPFRFVGAEGKVLQIDGGYYPMIGNRKFRQGKGQAAADAATQNGLPGLFQIGYERAMTPQGHLRERVESAAYPLDLHLDALPRHLVKESKDLAFRMDAKQVYRVLTDRRVMESLHQALGEHGYDTVVKWLTDSVNDVMLPTDASNFALDTFRHLRSATYKSTFALNIPQILQNFADGAGIGEIMPHKYFAKAALELGRNIESMRDLWIQGERVSHSLVDEIANKSGEMRLRLEGIRGGPLMKDLESTFKRSGFGLGFEKLQDLMVRPFEVSQAMTEFAAFKGAYEHAMDPVAKGGLGLDDAAAVKHAEAQVRRMFGGKRTMDLTPLQRNKIAQQFTMFWGWSASQLNKFMRAGSISRQQWTEGQKLRALRTMTASCASLWGIALASALLTGRFAKDDDQDGETSAGEIGGWAWHEGWTFPLYSLPIAGSFMRGMTDDRPARDVSLTPWTRPLNAFFKAKQATARAMDEAADDGAEVDAFLAWVAAGGQLAGLPVPQATRTAGYWADPGRAGDESFMEDALGTAFGKRRAGTVLDYVQTKREGEPQ